MRRFNWGDDLAWDQDFEETGVGSPATGTDTSWIDTVNIAFFSGHGSAGGFMFGIASKDDGTAKPSELKLGNGKLDWIALDACQVLEYDNGNVFNRIGWPVFKGLHYILGFDTVARDESKRGRYLAENLNSGDRVRDAWRKACQETEDAAHGTRTCGPTRAARTRSTTTGSARASCPPTRRRRRPSTTSARAAERRRQWRISHSQDWTSTGIGSRFCARRSRSSATRRWRSSPRRTA